MDLKGAEIRNIGQLCSVMGSKSEVPLNIRVPFYQRPYRWGEEEISNLLDDFYKNNNAEYFVGSVVLVGDMNSGAKYDVIDGQQRLTTVFLLNYLRFLIQRSRIEEMIAIRGMNLEKHLTDLKEYYVNLIGRHNENDITVAINQITDIMENLGSASDDERVRSYEEIAEIYRKAFMLPVRDYANMEAYNNEYQRLQFNFLKAGELALSYSREACNKVLINALSKVHVVVEKNRNLKIHSWYTDDEDERQYIDAITVEFNKIMSQITPDVDHLKEAKEADSIITKIIDNIKFCVIMTGNERDAYTLFEVLNDRALAINDLELTKNMFIKTYALTSNDNDTVMDRNIGEIDKIWSDEVFTKYLGAKKTQLIAYLSATYLTGNPDFKNEGTMKYRNSIEDRHLKQFSTSDPYTYQNIKSDIKIYKMVKKIIDVFGLKFDGTTQMYLDAENDDKKSVVYKTMHLLQSLKLHGVMAALVNIILKKVGELSYSPTNGCVDVNNFESKLKELIEDYKHNKTEYKIIFEWAHKLMVASLLSSSYLIPKKIASRIIEKIYIKSDELSSVCISNEEAVELREAFKGWTNTWRYGNKDDIKIKALFIKLFKTTKSNDNLVEAPTCHTFVVDKIHLDHLEARNKNQSAIEKYFEPKDPREERALYIDRLGNIMILDQDNNNAKDNLPLVLALPYYDAMVTNHWMIEEIKTMLNDNQYVTQKPDIKVPNEQFFNERKARLQKYFNAILDFTLSNKNHSIV
mgnify:CR=1 FL=1